MVPNHLLNGMILQVGILAHLLRMVVEPKHYAIWRFLKVIGHPLLIWEYDWISRGRWIAL